MIGAEILPSQNRMNGVTIPGKHCVTQQPPRPSAVKLFICSTRSHVRRSLLGKKSFFSALSADSAVNSSVVVNCYSEAVLIASGGCGILRIE